MKSNLVAVHRYYKNNVIIGYVIQDVRNGVTKEFESDKLKALISAGKLNVANLKLTSDGKLRLINESTEYAGIMDMDGKSDNSEHIDGKQHDFVMQYALKAMDEHSKLMKVRNFNPDTNTFVIRFTTLNINRSSIDILFKYSLTAVAKGIVIDIFIKVSPLAVRYKGKSYGVAGISDKCSRQFRVNESDIANEYVENYAKSQLGTQLRQAFGLAIHDIIVSMLEQDQKVDYILKSARSAHGLKKMIPAAKDVNTAEENYLDKRKALEDAILSHEPNESTEALLNAYDALRKDPMMSFAFVVGGLPHKCAILGILANRSSKK